MPIEFLCPGCKQLLQTPDDTAGMQATCPHCQQTMLVPGMPVAAPAPQSPPASGVEGPQADPPSSGSHHEQNQPVIPPPGSGIGSHSDSLAAASGSGAAGDSGFVPGGSGFATGSGVGSGLSRDPMESGFVSGQGPASGIGAAGEEPQAQLALPDTEQAAFAPPPPFGDDVEDPESLVSAAPDHFSIYPALGYGWEIMKANFNAFFAGAVLFAMATPFVLPLPLMVAGLGALAVRAARGRHPEIGVSLEGFNDIANTFSKMGLWLGLTFVVHVPLIGFWYLLHWIGIPGLPVIGLLVMMAGGMLYGVRLGWVPFAVLERPHLNFSQLIDHSLSISRGRTWELIQLAGLSYCAIMATLWGFCVGVVFFGIPIALGIGGSTYVLLTREAGR